MEISKKIIPVRWMKADTSLHIMRVLNDGASDPAALFVGGCVRNTLLGKDVADIDIATIHSPEKVQALCQASGLKTIPTGIDHGTVTVIVSDDSFEVTTLRRDVSTDGRRATVEFSVSWEEDAQRRDFTMNTLLADPQGHIYDPTGQGIDDLSNGRVKFVGIPEQRIKEDYLRILRFFRFYAYYGSKEPDQDVLVACKESADKISSLSRERISQEFFKIIMADNAPRILNLMFSHGVCADLPVSSSNPELLARLIAYQTNYGRQHLATRLCLLFANEYGLEASKDYLIYSHHQEREYLGLVRLLARDSKNLRAKDIIYEVGKDSAAQFFMLRASLGSQADIEQQMELVDKWDIPEFPLTGHDIAAAGIAQGPAIGRVLSQIRTWWQQQDYKPDRSECLAYLQKLLG